MVAVRRWYLFFVCLISLQSITWAVISLLRDLLVSGAQAPLDSIAFQIAVIVVGLPIFLAHWLWAQRLARNEPAERASAVRHLYLYVTLGAFLLPFLNNAYHLVETGLQLLSGNLSGSEDFGRSFRLSPVQEMLRNLIAMVVLALLWAYHRFVARDNRAALPEEEIPAAIRRLYILLFSALGLGLTIVGILELINLLLLQIPPRPVIVREAPPYQSMTQIILGLPLWLLFWTGAQRLFATGGERERDSTLRQIYLYAIVFISALGVVTNGALMLSGFLRRLFGLTVTGDVRPAVATIITLSIPWAYHSLVLRRDAQQDGKAPRQNTVRRIYLYLVASIGLGAFLSGLAGDVSVLIRALTDRTAISTSLRLDLANFTAAIIAGLPVWLLPWRQAQKAAVAEGPDGAAERRSVARKMYLYFYIFAATMTVLGGAIYIVYELITLALGERGTEGLLPDLGNAIAFVLIAVGVWLYHGYALRKDGRHARVEEVQALSAYTVALLDGEDGSFGRTLLARLRQQLPGLTLLPIGLNATAAEAMGAPVLGSDLAAQLAPANLVVGSWRMAATPSIAATIAASPARKLMVPTQLAGWEWAAVEPVGEEALAQQSVETIRQIVQGEERRPSRFASPALIIPAVIGILLLLCVFWMLVNIFSGIF